MVQLGLAELRAAYATGLTPSAVVEELYPQWENSAGVFILLVSKEELIARCAALEASGGVDLPLFGVPFAVKDNVDVAGVPTTAACPAFSYTPESSAPAVQALVNAGAIMVGKTNMDQFAAGLVGTRSPYGVAPNSFDDRFIPGGSSSGSAPAVASGLVSFALGTDTAGSGRVPAGYNGCVGVKGTVGYISTMGVVPACATLDCLTVFARSVADAAATARIMAATDGGAADVHRRSPAPARAPPAAGAPFRFGVPGPEHLDWDGPGSAGGAAMAAASAAQFEAAAARLEALGGARVAVDFAPFAQVAAMLYGTSFVAERYSGLRAFLDARPAGEGAAGAAGALALQRGVAGDERLLPVTRAIISGAGGFTATDVYDDIARLAKLRAAARAQLASVDLLLVPTVLEPYVIEEVAEEESAPTPRWTKNARNGRFTNFVNLLDMCGISVPQGLLRVDYGGDAGAGDAAHVARAALLARLGGPLDVALPFGVTLLAPGWWDEWVWGVGEALAAAAGVGCGPLGHGTGPPVRVRSAQAQAA